MTPRKILALVSVAVALLYGGFLCLLYCLQASMIYPGTKNRVDANPPQSQGAEVFKISTALGNVEALFMPATPAVDETRQPVVIFGHGNGEVIDYWVTALNGFRQRGIGVLLVEYPGYGRSTGSPSEAGGGAICLLAKDRFLRALILQSTFPSLDIFAAEYWAPAFLLRDHFDNLSSVAHFQGPVLVIHGRDDHLIPWKQGQRLAAASANSTFRLYDCGHGCWDPERLPFWRDALPFLLQAGVLVQPQVGT
jgi:uncharacterized protein